jgi:hypothetical protein
MRTFVIKVQTPAEWAWESMLDAANKIAEDLRDGEEHGKVRAEESTLIQDCPPPRVLVEHDF